MTDREERLRLVAERSVRWPRKTVCNDGMAYGASMPGPHCTGPLDCVAREGCFWRRFHGLTKV